MFAVRFFPHFDVRDRITAFLQVGYLSDSVFGCVIEHCDRNHRGQSACYPAGEEKIKADLVTVLVNEGNFVPGIH